jgi:hypothetical protein
MKNRIQPEQYIPYDLVSSSGNLIIDSGTKYFDINVPNNLNGNFNITGSLKVNDFNVLSPDISNTVLSFENGCRLVAGSNNFISGLNNCIVVANNSNITGSNSAILFGDSVNISSVRGVAIGKNINVTHDGAAVFADSTASPKISYGNDSISIEYSGGMNVRSKSYFTDDIFCDGNAVITGSISGLSLIVNGDTNILEDLNIGGSTSINGNASISNQLSVNGSLSVNNTCTLGQTFINNNGFINGVRITTINDQNLYSGYVNSTFLPKTTFSSYTGQINTTINSVSGLINSKLDTSAFNSFTGTTLPTRVVILSGDQNISGIKSFKSKAEFCDGFTFLSTNNCTRYVPTGRFGTGERGRVAYSGQYLYIATGDNQWGRIQISVW